MSLSQTLSSQFSKLLILLRSFSSLELSFSTFPAESWDFINPTLPCTSHYCAHIRAKQKKSRGRRKQRDLLHSLDTKAPPIWEEVSPPSEI